MASDTRPHALPPGHTLHWYRIERVLGYGGFGITYLGVDLNLEKQVAIKEYLPMELAVRKNDASVHPAGFGLKNAYRWGLERFLAEARTLARFKHPNIVQVLSVFEANNTAYMVMVYETGASLSQMLKKRHTLGESEIKSIALPIMDGLEQVHAAGFIHRDIKPGNIYLRRNGQAVLIDFGSARQALGMQTRTLTSLYSPGYAAFEQYHSKGEQGVWTDIYGLGATMYRAVTGRAPVAAIDRSAVLLKGGVDSLVPASRSAEGKYSPAFLAAIDHALAFRPEDRPQSLAAWRNELVGTVAAPDESVHRLLLTTPSAPYASPPTAAATVHGLEDLPPLRNDATRKNATVKDDRFGRWDALQHARIAAVVLAIGAGGYLERDRLLDGLRFTTGAGARLLERAKGDRNETASAPAAIAPLQQVESALADPEAEARRARIGELLEQAADAIAAGHLTGPEGDNAAARYREVLRIEPENDTAIKGLADIECSLVDAVDTALENEKLDIAEQRLEELRNYAPSATAIAELDERLEQAQAQVRRNAEVSALLRAAQADMTAGRLISPSGDNALEKYRRADALRPHMGVVRKAYIDIGNHLMMLANKASAAGRFAEAYEYLDTAKSILPDKVEIDDARAFVDVRRMTYMQAQQHRGEYQ